LKHFSAEQAPWLFENNLQALLAAFCEGEEEARVVGGAVRNTLLAQPVSDIDVATTTLPEETAARAKKLGFHVIPTGIDFGTVTVVARGRLYEVTTLRADVEADGRHAKVCFGRDWKTDAGRRDFTINALYADRNGRIYDNVGGLQDIENRVLRFIGDAEDRIHEDYLRILRFFRFYAWVGTGRPDAMGLKAAAKLKDGLNSLSAERVWNELKKLLCAPDPVRSLLWMRQSGVLAVVLPETEKRGIDSIHALVETEKSLAWKPDPLLRLESVMPPDAVRMKALGNRLRFSNAEKKRLVQWAVSGPVSVDISDPEIKKRIYREGRQPVLDRLRLAFAAACAGAADDKQTLMSAGRYAQLDAFARDWQVPVFPLKGQDIMALGLDPGPEIGKTLDELEDIWIQSGFQHNKISLLSLVGRKQKS